MTSGRQLNGTDLDSLFEPYHTGTKAAVTNIQINGVDIANRYQAVAAGNGTAYGTTTIQTNGTDIGTLFVKLGTYNSAMTASVNATTASAVVIGAGTFNATPIITISASGGSGSYTYQAPVQTVAGSIYTFGCTQTGNQYQFTVKNTNSNNNHQPDSSDWTISVTDGTTTQSFTITVSSS